MATRLRVFSSSVGTKLLIGATGLALFLYLITHIAGNLLVFAGRDTFNNYSHMLLSNPLIPVIEIGLVIDLPAAHLQDGVDVPGQPEGAAGEISAEEAGRAAEPQELRLVDDDLLRPLAAGVRGDSRQAVQVRHRVRRAGDRHPRSLPPRDGELRQPAAGGVLRAQHAGGRLASLARRRQRLSVGRRRPVALDAAHHRRRQGDGRADCRAASSSSPSGRISWERGHEAGCEGAVRPDRREVGPAQVRDEAGQPGQQAQVHDHRRRHRPGRRVGGGVARRARLQRPELLHPGQPAPGAQHRRPGRHQRREELPERRRQRLPALLRHDQGRRLPLARSQRLPAGAAERQHHRSVRRPGRAVRPRVRRAAGQPIVWRRPGLAHVLRPRADRPAAAARRLPVADAAGARGQGPAVRAPRDAGPGRHRRQGARDHRPQPGHRRDRALRRRRGDPRDRRIRHRLLPLDQRRELERHRVVARAQARRAVRQPVLHADPSDLHSGHRRPPVEADADEREPAQRRPRLGAEEAGRQAAARPDSRGRARLLPRAQVSRASATSCRATSRRETPSRCATRAAASARAHLAVYLDFPDAIKRLGIDAVARKVRQPVPHVPEDHRRGCVQSADAHLPGDPLHDGRSLGRLQPDEHDPRPARARRSQLLRPRREPAGRQRADAGAGRRLLHHPLHDRRLPGEHRAAEGHHRPRRVQGSPPIGCRSRSPSCWRSKAAAASARSIASSAASCGTTSAWRGPRPACAAR